MWSKQAPKGRSEGCCCKITRSGKRKTKAFVDAVKLKTSGHGTKRQWCQKRNHLLYGTLTIVYKIYHSKQEKAKKKIKAFL
jgi:hypothetical protein